MAALKYWLWLSSAGLSLRAKAALLERFGDAEAIFNAPDDSFSGLKGVAPSEAAVLKRRDLSLAEQLPDVCEEQHIRIISLQDAAYPKRLRHIFSPPVVLYVKGRLPVLDNRVPIAVIGTRHHSVYGLQMGAKLAGEIVECGGAVVSLLTSGIEQAAARSALKAGGLCIGVLGVPHEREKRLLAEDVAGYGALISEYPPFTRPLNSFFRDRNRIAAGLCAGVLVVEAPEKSGTQLFVAEAAEQGKEIFAVPGGIDARNSVGTHRMIQEGAKLVTNGWEVMSEFAPLYPMIRRPNEARKLASPRAVLEEIPVKPAPEKKKQSAPVEEKPVDKPEEKAYIDLSKQLDGLSEVQIQIVTAINHPQKHIDDIIEETGLPTATVLGQLTLLQIKGWVRREPGQRFSLNVTKK